MEEALVFCGRGVEVEVQFRSRGIGAFAVVALGFAVFRGQGNGWVKGFAARGFSHAGSQPNTHYPTPERS